MNYLRVIFLIFGVLFLTKTFAQEEHFDKNSVHPCGTPNVLYSFENDRTPIPNINRGDSITYIGLSLHNVGSDMGGSYISVSKILDGLCRLNKDYEPTKIQFFILGDINYIASSKWNSHDSVLDGAEMMFANNKPNSINCYFNSKAAGNAGYNLPYGGVSLLKGVVNTSDHTWAHELGHALSLQHPFLGWEGKRYDNTFYANPAPQKVTYDYTYFKDSLITGKTIIDTAWVELMDSTNCSYAADMICDSRPDYLAYRWTCNAQGVSSQLQKDPKGVDFRSDGSLIMSYSNDECQSRFTAGQINRMHYFIDLRKKSTVYPKTIPNLVGNTILNYPIDSQVVQYNNVVLKWDSVPNATRYILQLSILSSFSVVTLDTVVATNSIRLSNLLKDKTYYWKVRPYSQDYFCTKFTATEPFRTKDISSTIELPDTKITIFPNPVLSGQPIRYELKSNGEQPIFLEVFGVNGQRITSIEFEKIVGEQNGAFDINLSPGLYFIKVSDGKNIKTDKIIVE